LPIEALREALANAFVHRDYSIGGGSVGVALYDNRLEISSTGDLHFGLTPEALFEPHESKPWNPMIASVFYRRGIIRSSGESPFPLFPFGQHRKVKRPNTEKRLSLRAKI